MRRYIGLIAPLECALCGTVIEWWDDDGIPLCQLCRSRIPLIDGVRCSMCSIPLISEIGTCLRCRDRDFSFTSQHALYMYSGIVKDLISAYKTDGQHRLAAWFADSLYAHCPVLRDPAFSVVPVPFRPSARRKRGWDPVTEIVKALSKRHGVQTARALRRANGVSQKTLDFASRIVNLAGKITVRPGSTVPECAILIDDVFTTGATLHECAVVLKDSGAAEVRSLTVALDG